MKLPGLKRLITEDFKSDQQEMVGKIAFIINPMIDAILQALNKNLSINDNFNQKVVDIDLKVDAAGIPTIPVNIKYDLRTNCKGMQVIQVKNNSNSSVIPPHTPFVTFDQTSSSLIKIKHVTGLVANDSYTISVIIYAI